MVTDYGLHDRQAEAGALLLGGVVGSEEAGTFFWSEAFTRVAHFDANGVRVVGGAKSECATSGHGIEGVEHEILESTVEKIRVGVDFRQRFPEKIFRSDSRLAYGGELRLEKADRVSKRLVHVDADELRIRHLGEIAESSDDAVEIGEFSLESGGTFRENFLELRRAELARALKIFERDLHGKERIAQLMSEAAGQLAPSSDTFSLY